MTEQRDVSAILAAIGVGDPDAMEQLYVRYGPRLLCVCLRRLGDREAAQEVVQDIFVNVWRAMGTFAYQNETAFVVWLHTVARNAVISYVRKRQHQPTVTLSATSASAALCSPDVARRVCERLALRQALGRLSAGQREVIELRFVAGLSLSETAALLGRTEGAIKTQQYRALLRLHQDMRADDERCGSRWPRPHRSGFASHRA